MRVSSIDVGSNAIRMVIVEIEKNGDWVQLKKFRAPLRLGTDVFETQSLKPETIQSLVEVFKKIAKLNKKNKVQKTIALATSAMRDAKNGKQVVSLIKQTSRISLKVISGHEEAQIIRQAIANSNSNFIKKSLLVDIGGGSAELTGMIEDKIVFSKSFPLGVVRLLSLQKKNTTLSSYCQKYLDQAKSDSHKTKYEVMIGTGGNFDALAKLKLNLLNKAPQTQLTKKEFLLIQKKWKNLSLEQKLSLNLRPDRIDVLDVAMNLILQILETFKIQKIKMPMTGLKEGSIQKLLQYPH